MAPELNQMSFRKIKELILEVVNMVDNTIFISVKRTKNKRKITAKERAILIIKTVAIPLVLASVVVLALYLAMQSKFEADSLGKQSILPKERKSMMQ